MEGKIIRKNEISPRDKEEIKANIREHGNHSLAYSCLQDCIDYFFIPKTGFIGFSEITSIPLTRPAEDMAMHFRTSLIGLLQSQGFNVPERAQAKTVHVFSDPICDPQKRELLFKAFLERYSNPCFWQIYEGTSRALEKLGFKINHFGFETLLDLDSYEVAGNQKQNLKAARNKAKTLGYELIDVLPGKLDWNRAREISQEWIMGKISNRHELNFLARPLVLEDEEDVRVFGGYINGKLEGYVIFSPIYENRKVTGYLRDIIRTSDSAFQDFASRSLSNALTVEAIERFKREGKKVLSLGLSPFYDIEPIGNPATSLMFGGIYESANELYGFKRLSDSKDIYRGRKERVYFASRETAPIDETVDMFRLCRVFD